VSAPRVQRKPGARYLAAFVLARVAKDGAFAAAALDAELGRAVQLDARNRAFATELVYGTLRSLPWLEGEIARLAPRGIDALDARVRGHLAVAAYQLFFTRVPSFAAVSEAVDAVSSDRGPRMGAFANAVLRKLARRAESMDDAERQEAMIASAPAWLREALDRALSPSEARAFLRSGTEPPAVALRVEGGHERDADRDACLERLRAAAPDGSFEAGRVSPLAILARGAGKPQKLAGWQEGAWSVQEEGSQLAALAVGARAGETVLDACAGRGNKTGILARAVGEAGAVDVCDRNADKLDRLREDLARIALGARAAFAVDWSVGSGEVTGTYDRVLVDAPCSGVGTLRRRPEIVLRRTRPDLASMARAQVAITAGAARHLRPGGTLVYVVCSVLREEGEDVIRSLAEACPELEPAPFDTPEITTLFGETCAFRLSPSVHGTDGYFVARLTRRAGQLRSGAARL
jgi:16S rRNA (cytosine967-C5)-methyltransferase